MDRSRTFCNTLAQAAARCSIAVALVLGLYALLVALAACGKAPPEATPTPEPTFPPPGALRGSVSYDGRMHDPGYILVQLYRNPALQPITATQFSVSGGEYAFPGLMQGNYYVQVWLNATGHPGGPLPYDLVAWYDPDGDGQPNPIAVAVGSTADLGPTALHDLLTATVRGTAHYRGRQSPQHWLMVRAMGGRDGQQVLAETSCLDCLGAYTLPIAAQYFTLHAWLDANDNGVLDWPDPTGYFDPDQAGQPFVFDAAKTSPVTSYDFSLQDPAPQQRPAVNPLWAPTAPGGQVTALAARTDVSGTVFAIGGMPASPWTGAGYTAYSHVFRTTDGAATWRPVFTSLWDLRGLAVMGDTVVAVGAGGWAMDLIAVSTDGGLFWTVTFTSTFFVGGWYGLHAAVINPLSPRTMFAAGWQSDNAVECYAGVIMRSKNGGTGWDQVFKTPLSCSAAGESEFLSLAIDPLQGEIIFAAGAQVSQDRSIGVIYRSADGGDHWTRVYTSTVAAAFTSLLFDPITPTLLYAAGEPPDGPSGARLHRFQYAGRDQGLLFCSADGGRSWQQCYDKAGLYAVEGASGQLYAATAIAVHRAEGTAGGRQWQRGGTLPSTAGPIRSLLADPFIPGKLYAGTDCEGMYVSLDSGQTWQSQTAGMRAVVWPRAIVVDPQDKARFLVAAGVQGAFLTQDDGATWTPLSGARSWYALAMHPTDPRVILAGVEGDALTCILRSDDGGSTWAPASVKLTAGARDAPPHISTLVFSRSDPRVAYAGGSERVDWQDRAALFTSADGGRTFIPTLALPPETYNVLSLAVQPTNSKVVLLAGQCTTPDGDRVGALWRTQDGGATWERVYSPGGFNTVVFDPSNPDVAYAAGGPVLKTTDGGRTWQVIREGRVAGGNVALDPVHPQRVYNLGLKIFDESTDGGATWARFPYSGHEFNDLEMFPAALTVINRDGVQRTYAGAAGIFIGEKAESTRP
jgi:photosystem II stability/assembly factor-like uncharacterized protein